MAVADGRRRRLWRTRHCLRRRIDLETRQSEAGEADQAGSRDANPYDLTSREREVLTLLREGFTNRQIADQLFISPSTASVHVSNIVGKLEVPSRAAAAAIAVRLGMHPPASALTPSRGPEVALLHRP